MQPEKLWYLRRLDIFSGLSDEEYGIIDRDSTTLLLRKRQLLPYRGTAQQAVYFVKKGSIKLVRFTPDGHEVIIDIIGPSTLFGELEGSDDAGEVVAEALEETLLCMMRRDNFDRLMKAVPTLGLRITKLTGLRLRKILNRLVEMLYATVEARLATTLLFSCHMDRVVPSAGVRPERVGEYVVESFVTLIPIASIEFAECL